MLPAIDPLFGFGILATDQPGNFGIQINKNIVKQFHGSIKLLHKIRDKNGAKNN